MTRKPLITPAWEWAIIIGSAVNMIIGLVLLGHYALTHVLAWVLG